MKVKDGKVMFGSAVEFEQLGTSAIAYVRKVDAEDFNRRFPQVDDLPTGAPLWGLFAADGRPLAIADEEAALMADAMERDLVPVARH